MIGSQEIADQARYASPYAPRGLTYLGSGAFRDAYLGPDGVVYKVAISAGCVEDNRAEHDISKAIWDAADIPAIARLLEEVYVPQTSLYGDILAMEYIVGKPSVDVMDYCDIPFEVESACEALGIFDTHGNNVLECHDLTPTGARYAVVDLGTSSTDAVFQIAISGGEA